jgi:LysM repeat protein
LGADGLSGIPSSGVIKSLFADESGQEWILTAAGKIRVTDVSDWTKQSVTVTNPISNKFATIEGVTLDGFNYVQLDADKFVYLLKAGLARPTFNATDRAKLSVGMASDIPITLPPSSFALLPQGVLVLPAGTVVKNKTTRVVGIIDGESRMVTFGANSAQLAVPPFRRLSNLQLVGYGDQEVINPFKVSCAKQVYIAANSLLYETQLSLAKELPGKATALSDATCALLTITDQSFGRYVGLKSKDPNTGKNTSKAYKISKGKLLPFKTLADYKKDNVSEPPLVWVEESFIKNLELGKEIDLGASVKPTPSPKPTPKPKTYTIVSGDSLSSIALKFGTTVARLMELNGIVNADRIRIGQVLKLP